MEIAERVKNLIEEGVSLEEALNRALNEVVTRKPKSRTRKPKSRTRVKVFRDSYLEPDEPEPNWRGKTSYIKYEGTLPCGKRMSMERNLCCLTYCGRFKDTAEIEQCYSVLKFLKGIDED